MDLDKLLQKIEQILVDFTKETINSDVQFETELTGVRKVVSVTKKDFSKLKSEISKTATEKPINSEKLFFYFFNQIFNITNKYLKLSKQ